MRNINAPQGRR